MVTSRLRDCFDLNFYILYSCILYITLCYKNYVTNMENREEIQLSLISCTPLYCNEVDVKERLYRWQSNTVDNKCLKWA